MRRKIVIALRVLETVLLVGVGYALRRSMAEQAGSFFLLNISMDISVTQYAESVVLRTTVFGYVVSQIATILTPPSANSRFFRLSLLLSLLGIVTFVLELVRFFVGYELRILLDTAAALVVVDWLLTHAMVKTPAATAAEEEEEEEEEEPAGTVATPPAEYGEAHPS